MIGPGGVPAPEFFQAGLALGAGEPERLVVDGGQPGGVGRIDRAQQHPFTRDRGFPGKGQLGRHDSDHAAGAGAMLCTWPSNRCRGEP